MKDYNFSRQIHNNERYSFSWKPLWRASDIATWKLGQKLQWNASVNFQGNPWLLLFLCSQIHQIQCCLVTQKKSIREALTHSTFVEWLQEIWVTLSQYTTYLWSKITVYVLFLQCTPKNTYTKYFALHLLNVLSTNIDIQFVLNLNGIANYCISHMKKVDNMLTSTLKQQFKAPLMTMFWLFNECKEMGSTLHNKAHNKQPTSWIEGK